MMNVDVPMDWITLLGLAAAAVTTISLLPQLVRMWRTKSAKDISLVTFVVFCVGIFLWFVYGVLLNNLPIILANVFTLAQGLVILVLKVKYK
jgi:MtN3 and saliva related transmembrane protein